MTSLQIISMFRSTALVILAAALVAGNASAALSEDLQQAQTPPATNSSDKGAAPSTREQTSTETKSFASEETAKSTPQEPVKTEQNLSAPAQKPTAQPPAEKKPPAGYDEAVKLYNAGKFALATPKFEKPVQPLK